MVGGTAYTGYSTADSAWTSNIACVIYVPGRMRRFLVDFGGMGTVPDSAGFLSGPVFVLYRWSLIVLYRGLG
jgi:hypothetical protein